MQGVGKQGVNMTNLSEKEKIQLQYIVEQIKTSLSVEWPSSLWALCQWSRLRCLDYLSWFSMKLPWTSLKDTEIKVQSTLQASGLKWEEINHILLVGNKHVCQMIRQMIRLMSGLEPKFDLNPDTIVAQGASILLTLSSIMRLASLNIRDGKTTETDRVVVKDVTSPGNRSALQEKSK